MMYYHFRMREPKIPAEKYRISVDFDQLVETGDAVASGVVKGFVLATSQDVSTDLIDGGATVAENVVEQRIKSGVISIDYAVEFTATTTAGDVFIRRVKVEVEE